MKRESSYLEVKNPWNLGVSYKFNKYLDFSLQHLHGAQTSVTAKVAINPNRPPFKGGKELAPVPMRLRSPDALPKTNSNDGIIRKVLAADRFEIHTLSIIDETATIVVTNNKFRSTAQAVGRISSTLQRFTSDKVKFAKISFYSMGLRTATFHVDLEKINREQFDPTVRNVNSPSIFAIDEGASPENDIENKFIWGVGPYFSHRLFNPDLPLSMETGIEIQAGFQLLRGLKVSGSMRKSVLTNLTKNKRLDSGSPLPRVHSEWPLYDMAGQNGHIHDLKISYVKNLMPGLYGHAHAGLLEPFFAGVGGEILYKPSQWPLGIGLDIHRVRKRDYDMRFDLLDFETTVGHVSFYYDAGGMFDIELNAGRFLAGDWGATTTISREFGSGWEVGGYATLTDVPFSTFGEGSFDKAIYISIPMDWLTSKPTRSQRILTLRPITRDGGANLASARSLNRYIKRSHNASFNREFGRLWK